LVTCAVIASGAGSDAMRLERDIRDSKRVSPGNRVKVVPRILELALSVGVGFVSPLTIDREGVSRAWDMAMMLAIKSLDVTPDMIQVDGDRKIKGWLGNQVTIIKGDTKVPKISAASIVAKTLRDNLMEKLHITYPGYGWDTNKGYGTQFHRDMIAKLGPTPFHRGSYRMGGNQDELVRVINELREELFS